MAKYGGFKSEKRKKENARLKKQEEKRQRRFGQKETEVSQDHEGIIDGEQVEVEEGTVSTNEDEKT